MPLVIFSKRESESGECEKNPDDIEVITFMMSHLIHGSFFQNQAMQDIYDGRGMKVNPVRDIMLPHYFSK